MSLLDPNELTQICYENRKHVRCVIEGLPQQPRLPVPSVTISAVAIATELKDPLKQKPLPVRQHGITTMCQGARTNSHTKAAVASASYCCCLSHGIKCKTRRRLCVGCDTVQADHASEAGVAQGIFHGILVRHHGRIQEEVEEGLEEEVERTGEERTLKQPNTSAHALMIWNDTQARLEPQVTYERMYDNTSKRRASCSVVRSCHVRVSHGAHAISRNRAQGR